MPQQPQFTPDIVYQLISNNPQGRALVENLARMNQLQQAAQQFAPQIQQFAQNPIQAMQTIGDWAQGSVNQMAQQQQTGGNPQQEGASPNMGNEGPSMQNFGGGGMMGMAMDIVNKFERSLKEMTDLINEVKTSNTELVEKVSSLTIDIKNLEEINVDNDVLRLIKDSNTSLSKQVSGSNEILKNIKESNVSLAKQVAAITKDNKSLLSDLASTKEDIKKLI